MYTNRKATYRQANRERGRQTDIIIRDRQKCENKWRKQREIANLKKRDGLVRLTERDKGDVERRREGDNNLEIDT